ncbi:MAG TPA: alpha/beta hydrolase [Dongiaceae bacterium]|jgi:acetyl esterase/lipase|nr:alpha/beta hydrolase [Dongiaceae bacterium]
MILDWDDAYSNGAYIEGGALYPEKWATLAKAFRVEMRATGRAELDLRYGPAERETLDLFHPAGKAAGLAIFAHGGYWMAFDKSSWSHLAAGALERGWAFCIPSYTLAPEARISEISRQFARAIQFAAEHVGGPVRLAGHSAGGHLVTRMVCEDSALPGNVRGRIGHVVSISGLHDLRPLLRTGMNATLRMDEAEAAAESPALKRPMTQCSVTCWVGSAERPEFIRQNDLLANVWTGLGASMRSVHAEGRHHFDVIEDLADPASKLTEAYVG